MCCVLVFAACGDARQDESRLIEAAVSLQLDAGDSLSTGRPILVFVTQKDCEFCHLLRQRILFPMIRRGELRERVILREISLDPGFILQDFDDSPVEGRDFATRYKAYVTPTLLFLDEHGRNLAEPLTGTANIEFYGFYLAERIEEATTALSVAP